MKILALVVIVSIMLLSTGCSPSDPRENWKRVDVTDHFGIAVALAKKGISGCGSIPKVYQYRGGQVFNVYCEPANRWYGVNTMSNEVFQGFTDFPYR
ncbi:MAG TPA: hypothetical protein ENJ28_08935 [Gammaproteobacteria bacterium]|nr:hypothetical protein [Gammaproteobacteria bacterium]